VCAAPPLQSAAPALLSLLREFAVFVRVKPY
jgi:hypothetical protein